MAAELDRVASEDAAAVKAKKAAEAVAQRLNPVLHGADDGMAERTVGGLEVKLDDVEQQGAAAAQVDEEEEETGLMLASQINTHDVLHIGDIFPLAGRDATAYGRNMVTTSEGSYPTVSARGVFGTTGKWFYEVTIRQCGHGVFGWAVDGFRGRARRMQGVGEVPLSWGLACYERTGRATHTRVPDASFLVGDGSQRAFTRKWLAGDVIGVMVDIDAGDISYTLNGQELDVAFAGVARGLAIVSDALLQNLLPFKFAVGSHAAAPPATGTGRVVGPHPGGQVQHWV